jgi:ketosteroid isomerase-like protein
MYDADGNVVGEGRYIVIWKRTDAGWKLHRDIWN